MYRPFHQEFLLNCDYQTIRLEDYSIQFIEIDEQSFTIPISELDLKISSEVHWNAFVKQIPDNVTVILINDRPDCENPIYREFNSNTKKAYLFRLNNAGIPCKIVNNVSSS